MSRLIPCRRQAAGVVVGRPEGQGLRSDQGREVVEGRRAEVGGGVTAVGVAAGVAGVGVAAVAVLAAAIDVGVGVERSGERDQRIQPREVVVYRSPGQVGWRALLRQVDGQRRQNWVGECVRGR